MCRNVVCRSAAHSAASSSLAALLELEAELHERRRLLISTAHPRAAAVLKGASRISRCQACSSCTCGPLRYSGCAVQERVALDHLSEHVQPQSPPMRENIDARSARLKTRRRWKPKNSPRQLDSQAFATTITAGVVVRASAPRLLWREEQRGVRTHAQRVAMSQRKITRRPLHSIRAQSATRTLLRRPRTPGICCPGLRIDGPTSAGHLPTGPGP